MHSKSAATSVMLHIVLPIFPVRLLMDSVVKSWEYMGLIIEGERYRIQSIA